MADGEGEEMVDRYDWLWFLGGAAFTLFAVFVFKHLFNGGCNHFHQQTGAPQIIERQIEAVYAQDSEGKFYRRSRL